jgi:hypothetical protein
VGFRFQRRIKVFPGLTMNISKSGIGFSVGGRGLHAGVDSKGRRYTNVSLPGTGISWREYEKASPHGALPPAAGHRTTAPEGDPQPNPGSPGTRTTSVALAIAGLLVVAIMVLLLLAILVATLKHLH